MGFIPPLTSAELAPIFEGQLNVGLELQTGGQGAVFRAYSAAGDELALKIYHADQLDERLQREIDALAALCDPTLVELVTSGACDLRGESCRYLVTRFIAGESLASMISRTGRPLPVPGVARIGRDIASAIKCLWSKRIVHRDIKPNNIMIRPDGGSVLIDLGIARHTERTPVTTAGSVWGTPGYLSPEQAMARPLTCRSDVFALGIVMQECLLGRHPTRGQQPHLISGGPRTQGLGPHIPASLASLVDSMVHATAARRPLPEVVASQLERYLADP